MKSILWEKMKTANEGVKRTKPQSKRRRLKISWKLATTWDLEEEMNSPNPSMEKKKKKKREI